MRAMAEPAKTSDSPTTAPAVLRGPGRPRSAVAHQAILDAAIAILAESGFEALTIEGIAARAGVGKTTIYRRWPNKDMLLVDAIAGLVTTEDPLPESGVIREDLIRVVRRIRDNYGAGPIGRVLPALLSAQLTRPEFCEAVRASIVEPRRAGVLALVERAVERGELRPGTDPNIVVDLVTAPIFYAQVVFGRLPSPHDIEVMVDAVLDGCGA